MTYVHLDEAKVPLSQIAESLRKPSPNTHPIWRVSIQCIALDINGNDVTTVDFTYYVRASNEAEACTKAEEFLPWYPANEQGVILPKYDLADDPTAVIYTLDPDSAMKEYRSRREATILRRQSKYI